MGSIRAERADELRKDILDVAEKMFHDYGYAGATFQKIAETLGITKGAITYHFKNKHLIMAELVEIFFIAIRNFIDAHPEYYRNAYWRYSVMYIYAYRIIMSKRSFQELFYQEDQIVLWDNVLSKKLKFVYENIARDFGKSFTEDELLVTAVMDLGARRNMYHLYMKIPGLDSIDKFCRSHVYMIGCLSRLDEATIRENIKYAFEFTDAFELPPLPLFW